MPAGSVRHVAASQHDKKTRNVERGAHGPTARVSTCGTNSVSMFGGAALPFKILSKNLAR